LYFSANCWCQYWL